jgi:tetratricopeptide (TPR) repeat protein
MAKKVDGTVEKLWYAEQLVDEGKWDEARPIIEELEKETNFSPDDQLTYKALKCHLLRNKAAYDLAEEVYKESMEKSKYLLAFDVCFQKNFYLLKHSKYEELNTLITQMENLISKLTKEFSKEIVTKCQARLLYVRGRIHSWKGEFTEALSLFQKSLSLNEEIKNKPEIARLTRAVGVNYGAIHDYDKALEYHLNALKLYQEIGDKGQIAWCYVHIGNYLSLKGEFDQAIQNSLNGLTLAQEVENTVLTYYALRFLSTVYERKGELNQALEYAQRGLEIDKEEVGKWHFLNTLTVIAKIYLQKGQLDQALDYQEQRLALAQEIDNKEHISAALGNIGVIYWHQGVWDKALINLENSVDSFKEQGLETGEWGVWTLFQLISFTLDIKAQDKTTEYLERMKSINDMGENEFINQVYKTVKALVLRSSSHIEDKTKAQEIFRQIIAEKTIYHQLTELNMINLCESLLEELKAYEEVMALEKAKPLVKKLSASVQDLLIEIKALVNKLYTTAQNQRAFPSAISALILQAKLLMIEGDLSAVSQILNQALLTAEENNLTLLTQKVTTEINQLETQRETWKEMIETDAPYEKRLKQAKVTEYLENAKKIVIMHDVKSL